MPETISTREPKPPALGLPMIAVLGLALLAVPRVVLHDLGLIAEGAFVNGLLVFLPPAVWIAVVVWKRVPKPFLTLATVGAVYGVFLAIGHQILWDRSFGDDPPMLGGNLANLDPVAQDVIVRAFACVSSLFTGVIVGVVSGLIAWAIASLMKRSAE